ncbi:fungal-specific transcription factor domain-containing protein [Xylariaceae sp. FL0255]|nr:fungal-specific transcription factor domain-containing protein [Xylariaceae sp. FL0255]
MAAIERTETRSLVFVANQTMQQTIEVAHDGGPQQHTSPQHDTRVDQDSDDGNQLVSGDEDNGDDHESPGVVRNGKRKRPISVSCETCKQRKVKCDRGQPSCGWCRRNVVNCEYRERKKPGLRAGYGRELEQRLDKLEEILRSHSEILHSSYVAATASVRNSNPSLPSDHGTPRDSNAMFRPGDALIRTPQAETALFLQKPTAFPPNTQAMEFGLPQPTPTSIHSVVTDPFPGQAPLAGISPPGSLPTLQPSAATQDYYSHQQPPSMQSSPLAVAQGRTQMSQDHDLPPYDLLYTLVDLYFKYINTWCPILHRKATLDSLFGPSILDEADRALLHAIVATTLRFSVDARLTEDRRRHFHDASKQKVLLYGLENSSVKALQALVILALDLCGSSNGPPGWNIMALITRSVVQLGLAVETNSLSVSPNYASIYTLRAMILPEPKDFIEEESRRRLFWMIYLLDRYGTIATAFDFGLGDKDIDRTLPCRDDLWIKNQKVETRWFNQVDQAPDQPGHEINRPEHLGAFSYYIEILGILSKIHQFLRQPVDIGALSDVEQWQLRYKELDGLLTSWKFGLPGDYGNMAKLYQPGSKTLSATWVMLHATYHTAVIRLHSSAAYPTTRSPIFTPSYSASQRCHGAVENIAALGEFVVQNSMLNRLGPPFAFTLWVAARLLLVHGSTVEHKLAPQIAFLVDTLREMGRYWPVAARYCQLLQRVLDEHSDSERAVGHTGERVMPSSVKILADMRRTAFDLDFLISRQPKHAAGGPNGNANGMSRMQSVTPARTPAPNELEYLDVFEFFNVPRLPMAHEASLIGPPQPMNGQHDMDGADTPGVGIVKQGVVGPSPTNGGPMMNEFNITNFIMDANSDWLFKPGTA